MKGLPTILRISGMLLVLQGVLMASVPTPISSVPFEVPGPGTYSIATPLELAPADADKPAILVKDTNNVTIEFVYEGCITLPHCTDSTAIEVDSAQYVEIRAMVPARTGPVKPQIKRVHCGDVKGASLPKEPTQTGVLLKNVLNLQMINLATEDLTYGVATGIDQAAQQMNNSNVNIFTCQFGTQDYERGCAIKLCNMEHLAISGCTFIGGLKGIDLFNNVKNTQIAPANTFSRVLDTAVCVQSIDDPSCGYHTHSTTEEIVLAQNTFTDCGAALKALGVSKLSMSDCMVKSGQWSSYDVYFGTPAKDGKRIGPVASYFTLNGSTFTGSASQYAHVVIGGVEPLTGAEHVALVGNTFSNEEAVDLFWGVVAPQVTGLDIENCSLSSFGLARDEFACPAINDESCIMKSSNIHLGLPLKGEFTQPLVSQANIIKTICKGPSQIGIRSDTGKVKVPNTDITIKDCTVTADEAGIELSNTINSRVINTKITYVSGSYCANGIGIHIPRKHGQKEPLKKMSNIIEGNNVSYNAHGIVIEPGLWGNHVLNNTVIRNKHCQIYVNGATEVEGNKVQGRTGPDQLYNRECLGDKSKKYRRTKISLPDFFYALMEMQQLS